MKYVRLVAVLVLESALACAVGAMLFLEVAFDKKVASKDRLALALEEARDFLRGACESIEEDMLF